MKVVSSHPDTSLRNVKCIRSSTKPYFREIGKVDIGNSHALTVRAYDRRSFPYHQHSMGTRWVPGRHLVVFTSGDHHIALSPRSLFDRSWTARACIRTLRRAVSSLDLFFFVHLLPHLCPISLPLFPSFSSLDR